MDTSEETARYDVHFRFTLTVSAQNPFHAAQEATADLMDIDAATIKAGLIASGVEVAPDDEDDEE